MKQVTDMYVTGAEPGMRDYVYAIFDDPDSGEGYAIELGVAEDLPLYQRYQSGGAKPFVVVDGDEVAVVYDVGGGQKEVWVEGRGREGAGGIDYVFPGHLSEAEIARRGLEAYRGRALYGGSLEKGPVWGIPRKRNPDFSSAELEYMRSVLDEIYFDLDPEVDTTPAERAYWGPVMRKLTPAAHGTVSSSEWREVAAHMPMSPDEDADYPGLRVYVERLADPRQPPWGRREPREHVWGIPQPPERPRRRRRNATGALRRRLMP